MNKSFLSSLVLAIAMLVMPRVVLAFNPPPLNGHHVVDQSGRLSQDDVRYLDQKLEVENKQTTNEIGVLVISKLNGEDIKDIGYTTAKAWQLGKSGKDNGVLFLIVTDDRKARIDTGKGVGAALTDLQCNDIIKKKIRPQFRAGNLRQAIDDGTSAAANLLRVDQGIAPVATNSSVSDSPPVTEAASNPVGAAPVPMSHTPMGWTIAIVCTVSGFGLLFLWMSWPRRKEYEYDSYTPSPPVPSYSSPIYTTSNTPSPSYSDERTTVPLPTPYPVPSPTYPITSQGSGYSPRHYTPVIEEREEEEEDDNDVGAIAGAIGAAASILSYDDDDNDSSSTDDSWGGSSSDDDTFSGGGGDFGGGGSDDDL